jgi:3-oxoacyl-[acyl-carrier-protein] synthase-3
MRTMTTAASVHVVAAGHAHPATVLTSDELVGVVPGLRAGWLDERLGITSRHVLLAHESLADLAVVAVVDALDEAGWQPNTVDLLICATSFVDEILPATASFVSRAINPSAIAFDVNAACASFPYAVGIAEAMMAGRPDLDRVVVCAAERPTVWADYQDRESSVFWGDSAGCVLLQRSRPTSGFRIVQVALANDNEHPEKVRVRHHGLFHHDGRYSYQQVLDLSERTAREVLKSAGLESGELRAFVGHQSNMRLLEALGERLGIDWDRQWHNVEWAGNQAGAGVATAFSAGWHANGAGLRPGDHVLLAAVGGGYSAGAVLLEWIG